MKTTQLRKSLVLLSLLTFGSSAFAMKLEVKGVKEGGTLPMEAVYNSFGCTGQNVSPEISWSDVPKEAKSLALDIYDPDAPTGSGWWHWVVVNIPVTAKGLPKGAGSADGKALPAGAIQIRTDFNTADYGGPCPPPGDKPHHYVFTLHALKAEKLDLKSEVPAAQAGYFVKSNEIAKAKFTATFGRPKEK